MKRFLRWLVGLSVVMRCLVIALLVHLGLLFVLAAIPVAQRLRDVVRGLPPLQLGDQPLPPVVTDDPPPLPPGPGRPTPPGVLPSLGGPRPPLPTGNGRPGGLELITTASADEFMAGDRLAVVPGASATPGWQPGTAVLPPGIACPTDFGDRKTNIVIETAKDPEVDRAVLAALRWLAQHQADDGSWKVGPSPAAGTALATLAFLGRGFTGDRGEFSRAINNALTFLVGCLGDDGFVKEKNMYAQGAVTLALAEAYGLTRNPKIQAALERAVAANLAAQRVTKAVGQRGGWRYTLTAADSDTSVSGWMIMGLKSAKLAGLEIPAAAFDDAANYLWSTYDDAGGFAYTGKGSRSVNMTGVGVLCQQFLGRGADPRLKPALDYLRQQKLDWAGTDAGWPLYGWYYITQAMFQAGGANWEHWHRQFRKTLLDAQAADGHWDPPPRGKSDPREPAYATSLCCLMLEVYYRYAPVARQVTHR